MSNFINKALDDIGGLFSDNQRSDTYIGIVTYAFPWLNLYAVSPVTNGVTSKSMELVSGPDSTSYSGTLFTTYTIGTSVIVCTDQNTHGSMSLTGYIVGPAAVGLNDPENVPINSVAPSANILSVLSKVFDNICSIGESMYLSIRKRFTQPNDLLCGDTNISSTPGNGISILKHMTRIQCGKGCFIELDSILSRIRIVTERLEYVGPLRYYQDMSGRGSILEYNQTAVSYEEGTLGLFDESGRKPVFRKKESAGDITSGWQTSVSIPELSSGKSDDVYSNKVRYDGSVYMESAKGFEIKKTLNIISPYQKADPEGFGSIVREVEEFPELSNNYGSNDGEYQTNKSLSMSSEYLDRINSEFPRVGANADTWGLSYDNHTDKVKEALSSTTELNPIKDDQQYPLPDTITLKDPHTGKSYTYFKSESGFRQDPDGSLVFYDGYGSEIRMTRGNIIISSAADVILRPGRDMHSMAGRHTAIVTQGDAVVHSSTADVYIKGNRNVSVLSGVDKEGKTIIDDRGAGVLVRSLSNASLAAHDVFVGNIPEDTTNTGLGASKGSGKVVIGGGDNTLITGTSIAVSGESIDAIALSGSNNKTSWLSIDTDRMIAISDKNYISGETYLGHISGVMTASIGNKVISAGNQSRRSHLYIQANVDACYGINCRQVWAEQLIGVRVYAGNADRSSGIKSAVKSPTINSTPPVVTHNGYISVMYSGAWSDSFTISNQFKYPSSSDLNIKSGTYTIPGMLWQKYLKHDKVWKETMIPDIKDTNNISMVYPGAEAWNGVVSVGSSEYKPILGGYKING